MKALFWLALLSLLGSVPSLCRAVPIRVESVTLTQVTGNPTLAFPQEGNTGSLFLAEVISSNVRDLSGASIGVPITESAMWEIRFSILDPGLIVTLETTIEVDGFVSTIGDADISASTSGITSLSNGKSTGLQLSCSSGFFGTCDIPPSPVEERYIQTIVSPEVGSIISFSGEFDTFTEGHSSLLSSAGAEAFFEMLFALDAEPFPASEPSSLVLVVSAMGALLLGAAVRKREIGT
jgi:hypothetical protein